MFFSFIGDGVFGLRVFMGDFDLWVVFCDGLVDLIGCVGVVGLLCLMMVFLILLLWILYLFSWFDWKEGVGEVGCGVG